MVGSAGRYLELGVADFRGDHFILNVLFIGQHEADARRILLLNAIGRIVLFENERRAGGDSFG